MKVYDFNNIVLMKYGVHAKEAVDSIIERKQQEYEKCSELFWGYNGVLCNPLTQVQPFLEYNRKKGQDTYLLLSRTYSDYNGEAEEAGVYSRDKINWIELPKGIRVVGSKYAIVCEELRECKLKINMHEYSVAIGNSAGKNLSDYMRGRVDKACAERINQISKVEQNMIEISYYAKIRDAVFIK